MRAAIRSEVAAIDPCDEQESRDQAETLAWIDSGAEIIRIAKPATPPKHLISYFALIDGDHILLVDHINAQLWLPNGGHVEPGEHPKTTVEREAAEELGIVPRFVSDRPVFLTVTKTVGLTAGHTDVSLWYVLQGDRTLPLVYDQLEFNGIRWFPRDEVPFDRTDPQLKRFLTKLQSLGLN